MSTKCMEALEAASKLLDKQEATIKKQTDKISKLELYIDEMKEIISSLRNSSFTYATVVGFDKRSVGDTGETIEPIKNLVEYIQAIPISARAKKYTEYVWFMKRNIAPIIASAGIRYLK